jgi:hypothetical protein
VFDGAAKLQVTGDRVGSDPDGCGWSTRARFPRLPNRRLPRWQFEPDNTTGALPDLDVLQAAFPGRPVSLSRWIMRPHPEFGGRTPREEAITHGSQSVINVARNLTAAGW